jgi:hypothetical protein
VKSLRRQEPDRASRWILGWVLGGAVVALAATLLLTLIALARRIVRQAGEIEEAIDGARENTAALFDLSSVNLSLDQVTRELRAARASR